MANAIVGSLKLLLLAALFGVPIGLLGGVYLAEFGGRTVPFLVRYTADLMNGVPSIVIGIFAYALVVMPMHHFSTLAGGIALGDHGDSHGAAQYGKFSAGRAALAARRLLCAGREQMENDRDGRAARPLRAAS